MIIICDYCGHYVCPSSCPSFNGRLISLGTAVGKCHICSSNVYRDEAHHVHDGRILCEDCASELITDELLEFLDCADIKEFFDLLW